MKTAKRGKLATVIPLTVDWGNHGAVHYWDNFLVLMLKLSCNILIVIYLQISLEIFCCLRGTFNKSAQYSSCSCVKHGRDLLQRRKT